MNPMMAMLGQIMRGGGNPQQLLQQMMGNNQIMGNPILKNTLEMAQKGNSKGIEELARNLYAEKGIDIEKAAEKLKNQFGIN